MMKGKKSMKLLRIVKGKGEFSINGIDYKVIDELTKEDIFSIIEKVILDETVEFDEITETVKVENLAQDIVYSNLLTKLKELQSRRQAIIDESKSDFSEALKKYSK
ncbi:MAG: hypothetical protein RBR50_03360 [Candidatus Izemoplasmatales bacterium]|nr:hypothetical protein [Candidatus Izemoplasmatales bacterium]